MTLIENGSDGANGGGSWITGVEGRSVWVRSITFTLPSAMALANCINRSPDMVVSLGVLGCGNCLLHETSSLK